MLASENPKTLYEKVAEYIINFGKTTNNANLTKLNKNAQIYLLQSKHSKKLLKELEEISKKNNLELKITITSNNNEGSNLFRTSQKDLLFYKSCYENANKESQIRKS